MLSLLRDTFMRLFKSQSTSTVDFQRKTRKPCTKPFPIPSHLATKETIIPCGVESRSSTRQVPLLLQGGRVLKGKEGAGLFHPGLPRSTMENCAKIGPNRNAKRGEAVKRKPSSVTVRIVECCISFSIVSEQL